MSIVIRPATEADYDVLARIWWQGQTPVDGSPIPAELYDTLRARLPQEIVDSGWRVFAAVRAGRVVGLLALSPREKSLRQIFIDETMRSQRIGKALLDFTKAEMPDGFWLRTHSANTGGHRFYEREGLTHLRTEPHPQYPESVFRIYGWRYGAAPRPSTSSG